MVSQARIRAPTAVYSGLILWLSEARGGRQPPKALKVPKPTSRHGEADSDSERQKAHGGSPLKI